MCARLGCGGLAEEAECIRLDQPTTSCVWWQFHFKDNRDIVARLEVRDVSRQESNPIDRGGWLIGREYADKRGCEGPSRHRVGGLMQSYLPSGLRSCRCCEVGESSYQWFVLHRCRHRA